MTRQIVDTRFLNQYKDQVDQAMYIYPELRCYLKSSVTIVNGTHTTDGYEVLFDNGRPYLQMFVVIEDGYADVKWLNAVFEGDVKLLWTMDDVLKDPLLFKNICEIKQHPSRNFIVVEVMLKVEDTISSFFIPVVCTNRNVFDTMLYDKLIKTEYGQERWERFLKNNFRFKHPEYHVYYLDNLEIVKHIGEHKGKRQAYVKQRRPLPMEDKPFLTENAIKEMVFKCIDREALIEGEI